MFFYFLFFLFFLMIFFIGANNSQGFHIDSKTANLEKKEIYNATPRPGWGNPCSIFCQVNEFTFLNWHDAMTGLADYVER